MVYAFVVHHRHGGIWATFSDFYFYGYPRVPAIHLNGYSYINGAYYKLAEGVPAVASTHLNLVAVVDSPAQG